MQVFGKKKRIYMDYASATPTDLEVFSAMSKYSKSNFANPSALHKEGMEAKSVLISSRESISKILNSRSTEIVFTSGGTESNNLAVMGVFKSALAMGISRPHIITTNIEHPAILNVCEEIKKMGGEVTYLKVSEEGLILPQDVYNAIKENTVLVTVMYANNEIGTIEPIENIARKIKEWKSKNKSKNNYPYFHTDACQAGLFLSLNISSLGVDLLTLDGIKIYGPAGVGLLYVKSGVSISPIVLGGGQEKGLRSGTENVIGIVGLAKAMEIAESLKKSESERLTDIRDYAIEKILSNFPKAKLNGSKENRLPNNVNVCFPGMDSEFMVVALDVAGISASYSSACKTMDEDSSSFVIKALGREECSLSSLRFSFGRDTQKKDIDILVSVLRKVIVLL